MVRVAWSRGFCRRCVVFPRRQRRHRNGTGSAPERTRPIRLLCAGVVLVAVVLRGGRRAWNTPAAAMRGAALLVRGAWAVAAIRERLSGVLPAAGAAAQPQHRLLHARSDAGAAPDLQRMGQARHLLGVEPHRLFRNHPQGARSREDPGGLSRADRAAHGNARRGRGRLREGQSRPDPRRRRRNLRQPAAGRGAHLHGQGFWFPPVSGDRPTQVCRRDNVVMPPLRGGRRAALTR